MAGVNSGSLASLIIGCSLVYASYSSLEPLQSKAP